MDHHLPDNQDDLSPKQLLTNSNKIHVQVPSNETISSTNLSTATTAQPRSRLPDAPKATMPTTKVQQRKELPSLDECLYGTRTRKSPFIPSQEDKPKNDKDESDSGVDSTELLDTSIDDDELHTRWSQNAEIRLDYHDIDMTTLRKLCSNGGGIPEDDDDPRGICHRGVAWRVLLNQLPTRDIHASWPKTLPPQRKLYWEFVDQYLNYAIDDGKSLKGTTFGQRVGNNNPDPSSKCPIDFESSSTMHHEVDISGTNENDPCGLGKEQQDEPTLDSPSAIEDLKEVENGPTQQNRKLHESIEDISTCVSPWSDTSLRQSSAHIRVTEDIYNVFPPHSKFRDLWKQSGITLNKGESAAAIGMNQLRIPEELLSDDDDNDIIHSTYTESDNNCNQELSKDSQRIDAANPKSSSEELTVDKSLDNEPGASEKRESRNERLFLSYCKDAKLLEEIRKDVVRTHPHLRFYLEPKYNLGIRRHAAMERVLFIWAKLNGNLYVQGMNEIVGTIYYVLANDKSTSLPHHDGSVSYWADHAEEDTYYLFHNLMSTMDIRDVFVADLDHDSTVGLHARIQNIEGLLQKHDPEIYQHLKGTLKIDTSFYAIRWLTTLLSREFLLPDTIRLWDSMFASTHKENFLRYVCGSMVVAIRTKLFRGDFGTCLKLLQNYPSGEIGMDELLESSRSLWIYETQISLACRKGGISLHQALQMIVPPPGIIMAFGFQGGIPPKLSDQISEAANSMGEKGIGVIRSVGAAAVSNPNVTKMVGRAKQLWKTKRISVGRRSSINDINDVKTDANSKYGKNESEKYSGSPSRSIPGDESSGGGNEWDIIDSIIDGSSDILSSGSSCSVRTSSLDIIPITSTGSDKIAVSSIEESLSPRARDLWNRIRDNAGSPTNECSPNTDECSKVDEKAIGGRFWSRIRR